MNYELKSDQCASRINRTCSHTVHREAKRAYRLPTAPVSTSQNSTSNWCFA